MKPEVSEGITVSGVGEVTGSPDRVTIDLGVSVQAPTVGEASTVNATASNGLVSSLKASGVATPDIATSGYTIRPEYSWHNERRTLLGYRVENMVRATIREVTDVAEVLDAAVEAGGEHVQVHGLSFAIEDPAPLAEAARRLAWKDARSKADQLANLAGLTLGPVTWIEEMPGRPPTPIAFQALAQEGRAQLAGTPIEPGEAPVIVSLEVRFSILE